jgi:hypothetical protein
MGRDLSTGAMTVHMFLILEATRPEKADARWMSSLTRLALVVMNRASGTWRRICRAADAGMSTAEYAVGTVAAVAFAVVLYKVVRSDAVSAALTSIVNSALHAI